MRKTVCVDVDGVLAQYDGWKGVDHIGDPIPGAVEFTRSLAKHADILIYTTRCCEEINRPEKSHLLVNRVRDWLDRHGFAYHAIWDGQGKPICAAIVDDRAVSLRPQPGHEIASYTMALAAIQHLCEG